MQGTLTLDAHNDPNAVWIFQMRAGFAAAPGSAVRVINGGCEGNVFWQVKGSVTLGERSAFVGSLLAAGDITLRRDVSMSGHALSLGGTRSGEWLPACWPAPNRG